MKSLPKGCPASGIITFMDPREYKIRRKHERVPFREDMLIDGQKSCTSTDISEGGLFVSAIQYFVQGDVIEVSIPIKEEKITVKAEVKYCQQGIGMGIMFVDLNDEQKAKLRELIESIAGKAD